MGDTDSGIRHQTVQNVIYGLEFLHPVMQEEDLSSTVQLVVYDTFYFFFIEKDNLCLHRNPVRRRSVYDGKVTRAEKGKLKGSRNRRCRQSKGIDRHFHLAKLLLRSHSELLFLIYDKQT